MHGANMIASYEKKKSEKKIGTQLLVLKPLSKSTVYLYLKQFMDVVSNTSFPWGRGEEKFLYAFNLIN